MVGKSGVVAAVRAAAGGDVALCVVAARLLIHGFRASHITTGSVREAGRCMFGVC